MIHLSIENDSLSIATFMFPRDFLGFQGHFPGNPILPGVCKVQAILVALGEWKGKAVTLEELVSAKYQGPVSCGTRITMTCTETKLENGRVRVKASITSEGKKVSDLALQVRYGS